MEVLRKYSTATSVYFPMIKAGAQDFAQGGDWTPVAADTKISIDGGAFANTTNVPVHEGQGIWSLLLDDGASEIDGKIIVISIIDAATKAVEDQAILIATYGNASASIVTLPADVIQWLATAPNALVSQRVDVSVGAMAANVLTAAAIASNAITSAKLATDVIGAAQISAAAANKISDDLLKRDLDQVEASAAIHSLCTAALGATSRVKDNSGVQEIYRTDGTTKHAERNLTTDPTADPISEAGVATAP